MDRIPSYTQGCLDDLQPNTMICKVFVVDKATFKDGHSPVFMDKVYLQAGGIWGTEEDKECWGSWHCTSICISEDGPNEDGTYDLVHIPSNIIT